MKAQDLSAPNLTATEANTEYTGDIAHLPASAVKFPHLSRTEVIDTHHLPAEVFTDAVRRLGRLQELERDEIVRCLTEPGTTVVRAAERPGMSRASVYRKVARYGIKLPDRTRPKQS
ncbi:hypothetical protein [Streptomyces iranensis]|uniref:hypothetical protein n=1 Tax=Streptomyces iranensis TaxID=576784 RepID=UPI0039B749A2